MPLHKRLQVASEERAKRYGRKLKPLEHGLVPVIGIMGAGKSYWSVLEAVDIVTLHQRPVFTNVPFKFKPLRAYIYMQAKNIRDKALRREVSNLIRPMTKEHFLAFADRLEKLSDITERLKGKVQARGDLKAKPEFIENICVERAKRILHRVEPEVYAGRGANAVPPGSVFILDEIHKWLGSRDYRKEPPAMLTLMTMHRHYMLRIYMMTQRGMNVSTTARTIADSWVIVMNLARLPILGPFTLHRFLNFFIYRYVAHDGVDAEKAKIKPGVKAYKVRWEVPELRNKLIYRLYHSHTHGGSLGHLFAEMDDAIEEMTGTSKIKEKRMLGTKFNPRGPWHATKRLIHITCLLIVGFTVGRCAGDASNQERLAEQHEYLEGIREASAEAAAIQIGDDLAPAQDPERDQLSNFPSQTNARLTGITAEFAMIDGRRIDLGGQHHGLLLLGVDPGEGVSYWIDYEGVGYHWPIGRDAYPGRLPDALRILVARAVIEGMAANAPDDSATDDTQ